MKTYKYFKVGAVIAIATVCGLMFGACQPKSVQTKVPTTQGSTSQTEQTSSIGNSIEISNFKYAPATLTVKAGSTVKVTNKDTAGHSVTSDDGTSFDTDILSQGGTNEFAAPTKPGSYPFHCTAHPSIKGTLIVE